MDDSTLSYESPSDLPGHGRRTAAWIAALSLGVIYAMYALAVLAMLAVQIHADAVRPGRDHDDLGGFCCIFSPVLLGCGIGGTILLAKFSGLRRGSGAAGTAIFATTCVLTVLNLVFVVLLGISMSGVWFLTLAEKLLFLGSALPIPCSIVAVILTRRAMPYLSDPIVRENAV
jgi:hypothetical protein